MINTINTYNRKVKKHSLLDNESGSFLSQAKNSKLFLFSDKTKGKKKKKVITLSSGTHKPLLWTQENPIVNSLLVWRSTVQAPSFDVQKQKNERYDAGSDKTKWLVSL